jgi:hypothetical protein
MSLTPALTLLGLLLVLLAIPLALSLGPLLIGVIVLAYAARRAHVGLSASEGDSPPETLATLSRP